MSNQDIANTIISGDSIRQKIASIFPDSVILDSHFNFMSISQNILEATGYSSAELKGTSISRFSSDGTMMNVLEAKLHQGYFEESQFVICSKNGASILYAVSGFYLGLIADVNGMIVLKFKNLDEINLMHDQLEAKTAELDSFVYLSAHALRGPLATIKGLVNLAKISKKQDEIDFLLKQIDVFADKLDDKLHRLIYFAESDKGYESSQGEMSIQLVCQALQINIQEASIDHPVQFQYAIQQQFMSFLNGEVILSLLRSIVLFFCQQNKTSDNTLTLDAHSSESATEIIIRAKGFLLEQQMTEKLRYINFGYSELLQYPELINCYAAKKIIFKLRGNIQFILTPSNEVIVLITIPRPPAVKSVG